MSVLPCLASSPCGLGPYNESTRIPSREEGPMRFYRLLVAAMLAGSAATAAAQEAPRPDAFTAPLEVMRDFLRAETINPMQYGQFIEYLCDLVPGMWAEKLYDGSFEGLTPYKMAYLRETDFREQPWYPSGATNRADYVRDRTTRSAVPSARGSPRGTDPPGPAAS